jgi:uncharacterized membrane protein
MLTRAGLLRSIDAPRIKDAIGAAERQTSGEIRVSVATFFWGDVRKAAERAFERLGMTATRERNAILFFVVPSRRRFVVLGDAGIHAKVGAEFWTAVARSVEDHFRKGRYTDGLVQGVETVGRELAAHFPFDPATDKNELADDVDMDGR